MQTNRPIPTHQLIPTPQEEERKKECTCHNWQKGWHPPHTDRGFVMASRGGQPVRLCAIVVYIGQCTGTRARPDSAPKVPQKRGRNKKKRTPKSHATAKLAKSKSLCRAGPRPMHIYPSINHQSINVGVCVCSFVWRTWSRGPPFEYYSFLCCSCCGCLLPMLVAVG